MYYYIVLNDAVIDDPKSIGRVERICYTQEAAQNNRDTIRRGYKKARKPCSLKIVKVARSTYFTNFLKGGDVIEP